MTVGLRRACIVLMLLAIAGWAVPAIAMAGRGFAIEDEGTYLLSYRFWDTNPYFISGSQYFYGPFFALTGESAVSLRLLRLTMAICANVWFGLAFCRWLAQRRGVSLPGDLQVLGALLVAAGGGLTYLWSPLSPGYYDLTADACLVLMTLLFVQLAALPQVRWWVPVGAGVVSVVLVLTKWPAVTVPVLTQAVVVLAILHGSRRQATAYVASFGVGAGAALLGCHLWLVPLDRLLPALRTVSSLTAAGSHSMSSLLGVSVRTTAELLLGGVVVAAPMWLAYSVAVRLDGSGRRVLARVSVLAALAASAVVLPVVAGYRGGGERGRLMVVIVVAVLLLALCAASVPLGADRSSAGLPRAAPDVAPRHRGRLDLAVGLLLLVVPLAQAAGTNVPPVYVALTCVAMWSAALVLLSSRPRRSSISRWAVGASLVTTALLTAVIGGSTTLLSPFKTTDFRADTTAVPFLGLAVTPGQADEWTALQRSLAPHVTRGATPVLALDQAAGLTYLLGGVPIGSTWTDGGTPERTAGLVALACRQDGGLRDRKPVLVLDRAVDEDLASALAVCGVAFPADYRSLAVPGGPPGLHVWVPGAGST